jgi:hypothetical protein
MLIFCLLKAFDVTSYRREVTFLWGNRNQKLEKNAKSHHNQACGDPGGRLQPIGVGGVQWPGLVGEV